MAEGMEKLAKKTAEKLKITAGKPKEKIEPEAATPVVQEDPNEYFPFFVLIFC